MTWGWKRCFRLIMDFLFKFNSEENLGVVLDRAPWHMANRPLVLIVLIVRRVNQGKSH